MDFPTTGRVAVLALPLELASPPWASSGVAPSLPFSSELIILSVFTAVWSAEASRFNTSAEAEAPLSHMYVVGRNLSKPRQHLCDAMVFVRPNRCPIAAGRHRGAPPAAG
eukprot:COSAG01_NODE_24736_length_768_cov_2.174888_1_plen_109_part_10